MICSAAGWSSRMAGLGRRRWCWLRLYFTLYALIISIVRRCQSPRRNGEGVEVCRQLEGRIIGGGKILVELHRKSSPRSTSTGRSQDVVLLHGELRRGIEW